MWELYLGLTRLTENVGVKKVYIKIPVHRYGRYGEWWSAAVNVERVGRRRMSCMELGCRISKLSGFLNIPTLEWDQCGIQHLGGSWRPNDLSGVGFSRQKVQQPIRLCGQSQTSFVSYIDVIRTHLDRFRERNLMRKSQGVGQKMFQSKPRLQVSIHWQWEPAHQLSRERGRRRH
jgi:hypothetical protein